MAAEYQSRRRDRRGDLAAAVPPAGAHAREGPHPRGRLPTSLSRSPPIIRHRRPERHAAMLRIAVPNKGIARRDRRPRCSHEAGYAGRRDPKDLHRHRPAQRRRVLLPAPARHRHLRRLRRARCRHHRPRPAARLAAPGAVEIDALDFGASTFRFAGPARPLRDARATSRACASRPATRAWSATSSTSDGVAVDLVPLDGAVESAVRLGVADAVADVVSTGTTLRKQGLEIFGPVILESDGRADQRAEPRPTGTRDAAAPPAGRASSPASTC